MTDEAAKQLADAMNRLAAAVEAIPRTHGIFGGISLYHHGYSQLSQFATPGQYQQNQMRDGVS